MVDVKNQSFKPEYTAPQQIVCENTQESNSVLFVQKGIVHILRKVVGEISIKRSEKRLSRLKIFSDSFE